MKEIRILGWKLIFTGRKKNIIPIKLGPGKGVAFLMYEFRILWLGILFCRLKRCQGCGKFVCDHGGGIAETGHKGQFIRVLCKECALKSKRIPDELKLVIRLRCSGCNNINCPVKEMSKKYLIKTKNKKKQEIEQEVFLKAVNETAENINMSTTNNNRFSRKIIYNTF